jgi:predicted outer membrane repeat protein
MGGKSVTKVHLFELASLYLLRMNLKRFAVGVVCLVLSAVGISAPAKAGPDAPAVDAVVNACTEAAFNQALAAVQSSAGGTLTFGQSCPEPIIFGAQKIITKSVTIDGGSTIRLSGGNLTRLFAVTTPGRLTLKNIALTNGYAQNDDGGAVWLQNNTALFADNTRFEQNQSDNAGSAIFAQGNAAITLNSTTVQSNTASSATTGFGAINSTGPLTITSSVLRGNQSQAGGGALSASGRVIIRFTQIVGNSAEGIYYLGTAWMNIDNSTLDGNSLRGIRNTGYVSLYNVTIAGHRQQGVLNNGGTAFLSNTTISGNRFGIVNGAGNGQVTLNQVTLVGSGERNLRATTGQIFMQNTALAANNSDDCLFQDGVSSIISRGNNLSYVPPQNSDACKKVLTQPTDIYDTSPNLGPLADNGGFTWTHLPLAGSPLIDAGACVTGFIADQRNLPRPRGAACDIGAVEVQPPAPSPSPSPSPNTIVPRAHIPIVVK